MLPAPISTTAQGNQLEEAFVLWMKDHGYHSIVHVQGQPVVYSGGDYKPDILASRINYVWTLIMIMASSGLLTGMGMALFKVQLIANNPGLFLCFYFPAIILIGISVTKCKIRCWVECKNWVKSIDRSVIQSLYASMAVAQKKKGGIWEGILVSRSDFRSEIVELALHLGIQCYQWTGNEFKKVYYIESEPDIFEPYA